MTGKQIEAVIGAISALCAANRWLKDEEEYLMRTIEDCDAATAALTEILKDMTNGGSK